MRPRLRAGSMMVLGMMPCLIWLLGAPIVAHAAWSYNPEAPMVVARGLKQFPYVDVTSDTFGGCFVAWVHDTAGMGGSVPVHLQHILASGSADPNWPEDGVAVAPPGTPYSSWSQLWPKVVADGAGGALVAFEDSRFAQLHIFASHVLADGTIDPAWGVDGVAVCVAWLNQREPVASTDGAGGMIVAWEDNPLGTDVAAAHVTAEGVVSPGSSAGTPVCSAPNAQFKVIATVDAGATFLAWADERNGGDDIYVQKFGSGGVAQTEWQSNGVHVCATPAGRDGVFILGDGSGGLYVEFAENMDARMSHILSDGTRDPRWPPNGLSLGRPGVSKYTLAIARDGAGGVIGIWNEDDDYRLRVQHITSNGAVDPAWPGYGRAVDPRAYGIGNATAVADGMGGVLVTWTSVGHPESLHSQHVLGSGAIDPSWPASGRLTGADSHVGVPVSVTDGYGGALVVWSALFASQEIEFRVYAAKVPLSTNLAVKGASEENKTRLSGLLPNPARSDVNLTWTSRAGSITSLEVFDVRGRLVKQLLREFAGPGGHAVRWDLKDSEGRPVPLGLYFVRLRSLASVDVGRIVIVR